MLKEQSIILKMIVWTHWSRVMSYQRQAIILTNAGILSVRKLGTYYQWKPKRNWNIFAHENAFKMPSVVSKTWLYLSQRFFIVLIYSVCDTYNWAVVSCNTSHKILWEVGYGKYSVTLSDATRYWGVAVSPGPIYTGSFCKSGHNVYSTTPTIVIIYNIDSFYA